MTVFKTIEELIEENNSFITAIPNNMGINLVSVKGIEYDYREDGQIKEMKIIFIPSKEELKQICDNCKIEISKYGCACGGKPKQETLGYICPTTKKQCDDECCVSAEDCHIEAGIDVISEPKQERMYSDEDLAEAFEAGKKVGEDNACMAENYRREDFKEWFEQFKNK